MKVVLRDYQARDVVRIRGAMAVQRAVLYVSPTGSGKTVLFSYIVEGASKKNNPTAILVHRQELIRQSSMQLAAQGVEHRIVAPFKIIRQAMQMHLKAFGRSYIDHRSLIMVASVQTLVKRLELCVPMRLIVADEAHHAVAGSWDKIITAAVNAKILGVTATPQRLDGKGLGGHFTSMIVGETVQSLIDKEYLTPPRVYAPWVPEVKDVKSSYGDYKEKDLQAIMDMPTITGDAISHYKKLCDRVPAIAFCCTIEHAEHVAQEFRDAGYRAECVSAKTPSDVRYRAIQSLGDGTLDVLTNCGIVSEGTDVPIVGAAILLRPTKSLSLYLQMCGRILRKYEGKEYAFILDHAGNTHHHGLPQAPREWTLEGRKKRKKDEAEFPIHTCGQCYAVFPRRPGQSPICPYCGFTPPKELRKIIHEDGELEEVKFSPEWSAGKNLLTLPLAQAAALARTEDQLKELAAARKYKPGWVKAVMKARAERQAKKHAEEMMKYS